MSNYALILNDGNLCLNDIRVNFTKEQKIERLRQLNHIRKWARRHKRDTHEVLYYYTYDDILKQEAYEQKVKEYYKLYPHLLKNDDDDDY